VALGYKWTKTDQFANAKGFTHFMDPGSATTWAGKVRLALADPGTTIHVFTGGFTGGFEGMAERGLQAGPEATEEEMGYIARSVSSGQRSWGSIKFYDGAGNLLDQPSEPDWNLPAFAKALLRGPV
jgi:hypothetical protein